MALCLRSALLDRYGFRHGFSLRTGGVSLAPFDTLNLARGVGDDAEHVAENHRRLAREVGYDSERLFEVSQVHAADVALVDAALSAPAFRQREADALVLVSGQAAIGVRVADCAALLLACPATGAVAALHAGWRGTVAGVVAQAVSALCAAAGTRPERLIAALFPHIGREAFEVGEEVAALLAASAAGEPVVLRGAVKPHADLARALAAQLRRAGVTDTNLERVPGCTYTEKERFFSYRRDGAASGRHLAVIVPQC